MNDLELTQGYLKWWAGQQAMWAPGMASMLADLSSAWATCRIGM